MKIFHLENETDFSHIHTHIEKKTKHKISLPVDLQKCQSYQTEKGNHHLST